MKKIILCFAVILIVITISVNAVGFSDVPVSHQHYEAIAVLTECEIINGYADGTFKPDNAISRAEFTALFCRAAGIEGETGDSTAVVFSDVPTDHWAFGYISDAYYAGIINGMGDGTFAPQNDVTYEQAIKMIVSALGYTEEEVSGMGGYPNGYLAIAEAYELDYNVQGIVGYPADRGMVAQIIFNAIFANEPDFTEPAEPYPPTETPMPEGPIQPPVPHTDDGIDFDEISESPYRTIDTDSGQWRFYKFHQNFIMVYYADDEARYVYTTDTSLTNGEKTYTDKNDNNRIYAVSAGVMPKNTTQVTEQLMFEITNAFRAIHSLAPLEWNDILATAARNHSADMAERNYFDHTNPEGESPWDRMSALGYNWKACAENINYGYLNAAVSMDGWINSSGHRDNILTTKCTEIGIGWVAASSSYATQVFGSR